MSCPLNDIVVVSATSSQGVVRDTEYTETGATVEDDTDRNLLSMFDKYLNGQLKHLDDFDEDDDETSQDEAKDNMNDSVNEFTANYFQSARKQRHSKSRRSVFSNLLNTSRSKSAREVVQLLRHYYEEERNQTLLGSFVENEVELPFDIDSLGEEEAVDRLKEVVQEIQEKKVSIPKQILEHHRQDLEQLVKLLHGNREEIMKKRSQPLATELNEENEVRELTAQLMNRIKSIAKLQSIAREKMIDLETLQSVGNKFA